MEKKKHKKINTRNRWLIGIACTIIFILGFVTFYEKFDEITKFFQEDEITDNHKETRPNKYNDMENYYDDDKKSDDYFVGNYIEYFYVDYPVTCEKFRKNEIVYQITINKDHTAKIYTGSCMGEKETDLLWKNDNGVDLYYKDDSLFAKLGYVAGEGKITHLLINNIEFARTSTKYMKICSALDMRKIYVKTRVQYP